MRRLSKKTIIILVSLLTGGLFLIWYLNRKTKGFRNNPLGIEYRKENEWVGAIRPHNGNRFESFKSVEYGVRAGAIILRNYQKIGIATIDKIINRWAPSNENNTEEYIRYVSELTGYSKNDVIDVNVDKTLFYLLKVMAKYESGYSLTRDVFDKSQKL